MPLGAKLWRSGTDKAHKAKELLDRRSYIDMKGHYHLRGVDVEPFRRKIFERSGGRCENLIDKTWDEIVCDMDADPLKRCRALITWNGFEMHHEPSGYERYDSMESCFAICRECHRAAHNREPQLKSIPGIEMPK
jgi:hypothetical protein